ncbi:hypothetical protein [Paracoccus sediminilitoris]|uniref:hypothetical protein n=1 Tax=Paracoccus sediminilitoris TaxID=2202419 RepID=UPI000DBAB723|nr:hypothetical protein [Paracoccus sediminilitoris]
MADSRGALALLCHLSTARHFLGHRACDAHLLRDGPEATWHLAPQEAQNPVFYNQRFYRKRYRIENAFAHLHDWRGIATRYEHCGDIFLHAIILATIVICQI